MHLPSLIVVPEAYSQQRNGLPFGRSSAESIKLKASLCVPIPLKSVTLQSKTLMKLRRI